MPISPPTSSQASNTGTSLAFYNDLGLPTPASSGGSAGMIGSIDGGSARVLETLLNEQSTNATAVNAAMTSLTQRAQSLFASLINSASEIQSLDNSNIGLQKQLSDQKAQRATHLTALAQANAALAAAKKSGNPTAIQKAQAAVQQAQSLVDADNVKISGLDSKIASNSARINLLDASVLQTVGQIITLAATLKQVQETGAAKGQVWSAQQASVFRGVEQFAAQLQAEGLQGETQARQETGNKQLKIARLLAAARQADKQISGVTAGTADVQPASALTNAAVSATGSRLKIPV